MRNCWDWFTGDTNLFQNPFVDVNKCEDALVSKLPPTLIITAQFDPLHEEGEKFAKRLFSLGVKTHTFRMMSTIHGFITHGAATGYPAHEAYSNFAVQIISNWKSFLLK